MNIYLTGGNGFIGSHLKAALIERGHEVITDSPYDDVGLIIHLAAVTHIRQEFDPALFDVNIVQTRKLFDIAKRRNIRIIYASSCSASSLDNPYAYTKRYAEWLGSQHPNALGFRFFNVYGPNNNKGIVKRVIECCKTGETLALSGGGLIRDFIYVGDVVRDIIDHLETGTGIVDCGTGEGIKIIRLVWKILEVMDGNPLNIEESFCPTIGEQLESVSSRKVPDCLSLKEGLLKTIQS
jgi:nucleoside-diphosphate-sugar epimerase